MKLNYIALKMETKRKISWLCSHLPLAIFLTVAFFIVSAFIIIDYKESFSGLQTNKDVEITKPKICENKTRSCGSEALPKGIVSKTSNFQMRPLWGTPENKPPVNLLAIPAGIKQKDNVNKIVEKFSSSDFLIMLFHYDGVVDDWRDLEWSNNAIHISAINQTKWWFAKRFLHPDLVSDYAYIFLWDEDLGVENFHAGRYLSIIKEEGLHISQPALDPNTSEVHHEITARVKGSKVHRRIYKVHNDWTRCDKNSTGPPCTGWVEMMAPVFSTASWRCTWNMIQSDLTHGWGLDMHFGYCAQGDRTINVGIVDSEYVVHSGVPTLGGLATNEGLSVSDKLNDRKKVIKQSFMELEIFNKRWEKAAKEDECWTDPYQQPQKQSS